MSVKESLNGVPESLEARIALDRRRRAHLTAAWTFGVIGLFGIADLFGAMLQGRMTDTIVVRSVSAVVSGVAALVLLWESRRRRVPNEELKPSASQSSLVE
jgi:hypothetical protein